MENSAFVPNPIPPPALVVFSQAGGLPEALRMQRPFNPQETKDLHVPFATAGFGIRHVDGYPGLPAHLLHHLQPRFLHPALDPHTPFGSGAFRPLGPASSDAKSFPSAFAPPSKCPDVEGGAGRHDTSPRRQPQPRQPPGPPAAHLSSIFSPSEERAFSEGPGLQTRRPPGAGSASPGGSSPQPAVKEESMEEDREAASPASEGTERSTPEEGRGFRLGPVFGPVVGRCAGPEPLGGLGALGLGLGFGPAYRLAAAASPAAAAAIAKGQRCLLFDQGKKKIQRDPSCCPACGITLRPGELESHYIQEVERLYKLSSVRRVRRDASRPAQPPATPPAAAAANRRDALAATEATPEGRWEGNPHILPAYAPMERFETYQRIKANRQGRLRIKNRKRKPDEATCPVCNERVHGSLEELNSHVEQCVRKHGSGVDEEENVDVEGDSEMFVEYEWTGQRRIRASALLVGGYAGVGMATTSSASRPGEEEEDLVVDGDDTATFGPAQFSEADVVMPSVDGGPREEKERHALREAVISPGGTANCVSASENDNTLGTADTVEESATEDDAAAPEASECHQKTPSPEEDSGGPLVEALKNRIRELEGETRSVAIKCLICMDVYKKPVISICCWHVHCEECWLHTLGAKKLCPQCNMITSPSDLRRIYL
ncbi:E3 ubiquitin-protein ligase RNF220-like isoform X2 [Ischnura elegans]|uniref:E3 ubiquitin-protein ligase RNF220-like isoform X2 n=1 Tax=Ischnura elegans TaxID=197161 RepID=UPI001ED873A2|nr:E3 ubiquitin-protein ligase RNF220-like isoform X2 [Ischnura elegans]